MPGAAPNPDQIGRASTRLVQLSDPHVEVGRGDRDSALALAAAVRAVRELRPRPTAVLVSGDLVSVPGAREYERVRELLAPLAIPTYVLAGNHDDRDALREYFALAQPTGAVGEPFRYSVSLGDVRLVVCDTTIPGRIEGAFDLERRLWLEAELAADRETPTIVAMHHPPLLTGLPAFDAIGLDPADRAELAAVLIRHSQVRRVVAGHVHRGAFGLLGGSGVVTCPSTHLQAPLDFELTDPSLGPEPPAFAVHAAVNGAGTPAEIVSHIQPIADRGALPRRRGAGH